MKRYLFLLFIFALFPLGAQAATLTLGGSANATVGDTFNVPVLLYTEGSESANAISGTVTYPGNLLTLVAISKGGSIITLWPSDPSQTSSSAHFEGVILNPGWSGQGGTIVTLTFQAKAAGVAPVVFSDASVLANDGNATPILSGTTPASITIHSATATPPPAGTPTASGVSITSSTNPDQNKWYNSSTIELNWKAAPTATAVRIGYDKFATGQPTVVYDPSTTHKELILKDGTWYFHVQDKVSGAWSTVSTFALHIDTVAPSAPEIEFATSSATGGPTALFSSTDDLSGIAKYVVSVNGANPVDVRAADASSPYAIPAGSIGTNTLLVTAYDNAGNSASTTADFEVTALPSTPAPAGVSVLTRIEEFAAGHALLLFIIALIILLLLAAYFIRLPLAGVFGKTRRTPAHVQLHAQFTELREAIVQEMFAMRHAKTKRQLTDEEERFLEHFEKLLTKAEKNIEKDILA